jgi:hypothetical protein
MTDIRPVARQWRATSPQGKRTKWIHDADEGGGVTFGSFAGDYAHSFTVEYRNLYAEEYVQKLRDEIAALSAENEMLRGDLEDRG